MYNPYAQPAFREGAIRPMECFSEAVELVKPQYWEILGVTLIGSVLMLVSCSLLTGPAMCGIFFAYFHMMRRERVSVDMALRGFDYVGPAMLVFLVQFLIGLVVSAPGFVLQIVADTASHSRGQGGPANPAAAALGLFAFMFRFGGGIVNWVAAILFSFAYQLIVDRQLGAGDAMKLSMDAAVKNVGGLIVLGILNMLVGLAGVMACCVGAIFVLPVTYGMMAIGYRQVFPDLAPPAAPGWPPGGPGYTSYPGSPYGPGPSAPY